MISRTRYGVMKVPRLIAALWLLCSFGICLAENFIQIETAEMTSVGSVLTNIPQESRWPSTQKRTYKVLSGGEYTEVSNEGVLKVKKQMDRELLCASNPERCLVDIQVAAVPAIGNIQLVKIQIEVLDINDNSPVFDNPLIEKSMSEAVSVGTSIRLDSAVDPDYGTNSIQDYRLAEDSGSFSNHFELETITNIDGTKIPKLKLKLALDREKKGVHTLMLEAYDGGSPSRTGTATVHINILDSNDNVPSFEQKVYLVDVNEHEKTGTQIVQVVATDEDTGLNGQIQYNFPSVVSDKDQEIFELNSETGVIKIKDGSKLDFETKSIHHLSVEATDMGPNAIAAYTTVTVQVQDINDNKPMFDVAYMENELVKDSKDPEFDEIIMENVTAGEVVAFVTVTDQDAGVNGTVDCTLKHDVFSLTRIEARSGGYLLKVISELDREKKDSYDLTIEASDKGTPSQKNVKVLHLKVGDINDNAPEFDHDEFEAKVKEDSKKGTTVLTLKATDKDQKPGPNSKISYSFLPTHDQDGRPITLVDIFEVNRTTGEIKLVIENMLDAETELNPGYLVVSARDNGKPSKNTTTKIKITVVDVNDNAPIFKDKEYSFRVAEHAKEGMYIGQVTATDADRSADTNGKVSYSVVPYLSTDGSVSKTNADQWANMFVVESKTGYIHFYGNSTLLDREAFDDRPILITVKASDNGVVPRSANATVKIYLTDINDNKPFILRPNGRQDVGFVKIIPKSERSDSRSTENSNAPELLQPLRNGAMQTWATVVTVLEGINSSASDISSITLSRVQASDPDKGQNAVLTFKLIDGNADQYFAVDVRSGNVTFSKRVNLDKVRLGCHILKIEVSDQGEPKMKSDAYVNLYLSKLDAADVNATNAMRECQRNPLFPKPEQDSTNSFIFEGVSLYLIIGFGAFLIIIIIIIVIVLIKCCCCDKHKKSRSYNCQQGNTWNTSSGYDPDNKKSIRKRGSSRRSYNGQGTVDSRSSFHSEWTASQTQIATEKNDKVRVLPDLQSVGSAESRNAHDSGTGDSVSGEPYHQNHYTDMPDGGQKYMPMREPQYLQSHQSFSPMKYTGHMVDLPPQQVYSYGAEHPAMYGRTMISPKCNEECLLYGHGDHCWMPDSLLRTQPQGPIEMMSGGNPDRVVYQNHPDAHGLRYQGDTSTPYYYDPGKKFSHLSSTEGSDQLSYTKGQEDGYRHPGDGMPPHQGYQLPPVHAPSPHPHQRMYQNEAERDRAYINLQGYDPPQNQEEMHSNLSSTSSNNNPYGAALPQNHPRMQGHPQIFYQVSNMQNQRYEAVYMPGMHDHMPVHYKEDYSASNLLPPVTGVPTDYTQQWDHSGVPVSMEQQPLISQPEYQPQMRSGRTSNPVLDEKERLIPQDWQQAGQMNSQLPDSEVPNQVPSGDEKLMTIQENETDGLLL